MIKQFAYAILTSMKGSLSRLMPESPRRMRLAGEGYTILEVMIALIITSLLFVSVALTLGGRQETAQFNEAVRSYEAKIQNVISEVENGFYNNSFVCLAGLTGSPTFPSGAATPGANKGCVFAGKIIEPNTNDSTILTVVARQFVPNSTIEPASSIEQSDPVVVPNTKGIDEALIHNFGLRVTKIIDLNNTANELQSFGYMIRTSGDAQTGSSASNTGIELFGVRGSLSSSSTAALVNSFQSNEFYRLGRGLLLCIDNGGEKDASIALGINNSPKSLLSEIGPDDGGLCP